MADSSSLSERILVNIICSSIMEKGENDMFQSYEEALNWIHSRLRLGVKPGLKRMEWMMDKLDHPEKKFRPYILEERMEKAQR